MYKLADLNSANVSSASGHGWLATLGMCVPGLLCNAAFASIDLVELYNFLLRNFDTIQFKKLKVLTL